MVTLAIWIRRQSALTWAMVLSILVLVACSGEAHRTLRDSEGQSWDIGVDAHSDEDWSFESDVSGNDDPTYLQVDILDEDGEVISSTRTTGDGPMTVDVNAHTNAESVRVTSGVDDVGVSTSWNIPN